MVRGRGGCICCDGLSGKLGKYSRSIEEAATCSLQVVRAADFLWEQLGVLGASE